MRARLLWIALTQLAGLLASGCSYYNAMWSAKRHASDARQLEQHGQPSDARVQWAQAAAKTRSWRTDDAVVLRAEGLAYSGACRDAADLIAGARAIVQDATRRERIDLADAECALAGGDPVHAETALVGHAPSDDLFAAVVDRLGNDPGVHAVALPRTREQAARLRALALPSLIVPPSVVDGPSLVAGADVVVSAGGTMNREAVALGVPVYTTFAGRLGAVDERLLAEGRLRRLERVGDLVLERRTGTAARERRDPDWFVQQILEVARS